MSHIHIVRSTSTSAKKSRENAEQMAVQLQQEYGLDYEWESDHVLRFERAGLNGTMTLEPKQVTVEIKLGLLMRPFASVLKQHINDYFDAHHAPAKTHKRAS